MTDLSNQRFLAEYKNAEAPSREKMDEALWPKALDWRAGLQSLL